MPSNSQDKARRGSSNLSSQYQLISPGMPTDPRALTQNTKDQLINALRTHKVNTITELRRIEKVFAYIDSPEVQEPMTTAWRYYVESNNLLNELRANTRTYPFSSECLDEARILVMTDPNSQRSWNLCWLVLQKVATENLVTKHARMIASRPSTWGNRPAQPAHVDRLINVLVSEWTEALRLMLRHWDKPPTTTGT